MTHQFRTGEVRGSFVVEVFHLATFLSVASIRGRGTAGTHSILGLVEVANRSALGLESINTGIVGSNSIAGMGLHSTERRNLVTRNDNLAIELGLGVATLRGCVGRGIVAAGGECKGGTKGCHERHFFHIFSFF